MASLIVPLAYFFAVVVSLFIFSNIYRRRVAVSKRVESWFPSHPERDLYVTLLQSDPPAHEALVKAALIRRAVADIHRVFRIKEDKPALANLLQRGSIGDDLWNSFLQAEKELEVEIMEVINEAETFKQGWGGIIFQTANEIVQNEKLRESMNKVFLSRPILEQKYNVTKRLMPSISVQNGPAPAATPATPVAKPSGPSPPPTGAAPTETPAPAAAATPAPINLPPVPPTPSTPTTPGTPITPGGSKKSKKRK